MPVILPLLLLTVAAVFQWRKGRVAAAISVAAIFITFAIFQYFAIQIGWVPGIFLSSAGTDGAYRDTYYITVSNSQFLFQGGLAVLLAASLAAEAHFGHGKRNVLLTIAYWTWLVAVFTQQAPVSRVLTGGIPKRYVDYSEVFDRHFQVQSGLNLIQMLALLILAGLIVMSIFVKRLQSNP